MAVGRPHLAEADIGQAVVEGAYRLGELEGKGIRENRISTNEEHTWHLSHSRGIHRYKPKS